MRIISFQLPVVLSDLDGNRKRFLKAMAEHADDKDVIFMLPEMWGCGFDYKNLQNFAEHTYELISEIQSIINSDTLVITTHPETNQNKVFNTVYAVTKTAVIGKYRKNFLFSPTGEDNYFDKGDDICVVDFKGVRVGFLLCYEIRFPEMFRLTASAGADVVAIPAVWPEAKKDHWQTLTKARAVENQMYVIGCNCSVMHTKKKDMDCGYSVAYDPWGSNLYESVSGEHVLTCEINRENVNDIRQKIPSLSDAMKVFEIKRR
ncbi:Nitrilase/cyanide hydratase and apolipoprotein N- acyltransferase [Denitrovibrio acetiphilus DSM 12809]|uniref:Nitrilase/cyanide hydratase and apolipoprotein N-acyltransferase n=1 Tax=Denitrovibrio acetiphilus (strain DSM 12809 / NBRC 114555 / N2460) TaxID=522772 RepID=D4H7Q2_DENA2|nr:nitrilase-related carbon-nitrogen hydrolase [Denitrovibrio acetiphilus]ADD68051.1 Nitrilase/cyanide hydratase and apolipoprotein N- acyltransferase [Denitrovibrio acetiphilus DSM 12809]